MLSCFLARSLGFFYKDWEVREGFIIIPLATLCRAVILKHYSLCSWTCLCGRERGILSLKEVAEKYAVLPCTWTTTVACCCSENITEQDEGSKMCNFLWCCKSKFFITLWTDRRETRESACLRPLCQTTQIFLTGFLPGFQPGLLGVYAGNLFKSVVSLWLRSRIQKETQSQKLKNPLHMTGLKAPVELLLFSKTYCRATIAWALV